MRICSVESMVFLFNPMCAHICRRCDMYSYGVLVWELYHTTVPYSDYPMDQVNMRMRL